jgi:hypothetical protein
MFTRFGPFNPALPHGDPSKAHDHASRSLRGNQLMARAAWDHLVQDSKSHIHGTYFSSQANFPIVHGADTWWGLRLVQRASSELTGSTLRIHPPWLCFSIRGLVAGTYHVSQYTADLQGLKNNIVEYILRCSPLSLFCCVPCCVPCCKFAVSHSFIDTRIDCFVNI